MNKEQKITSKDVKDKNKVYSAIDKGTWRSNLKGGAEEYSWRQNVN